MVEDAMADGAVGLSTGLGYFPGMIAKPAELAALARVAAAAGGVLDLPPTRVLGQIFIFR